MPCARYEGFVRVLPTWFNQRITTVRPGDHPPSVSINPHLVNLSHQSGKVLALYVRNHPSGDPLARMVRAYRFVPQPRHLHVYLRRQIDRPNLVHAADS